MSWIEKQTVWTLGWGDGRKPGLLYFLLRSKAQNLHVRAARVSGDATVVFVGLLMANPRLLVGELALLLPLVSGAFWTTLRAFHLTRRLLASGLLRELALTPVGAAEIVRDVHLLAVRRPALAGVAWLAGHLFWMPAGPQGLLFAALFLVLMPALLWRFSAVASAIAIGLDSWRPSLETRRRAAMTGAIALLVLLLALALPPAVLLAVGLKRGGGLFLLLIPLTLLPGLSLIGALIWWLKRHRIDVDLGRLLTINASRARQLIETRLDL